MAYAFLTLIVLVVLLIPAKYDPAIQIKEWLERRKGDKK